MEFATEMRSNFGELLYGRNPRKDESNLYTVEQLLTSKTAT